MKQSRASNDPKDTLARPELVDPAAAVRIRRAVLDGLHAVGGGHFGGCSSCVELLLALFASRAMACVGPTGDKLLLSKGHASMTLYAVLSMLNADVEPLRRFGALGTQLQGHPDRTRFSLMDFSFGSLGQGVAVGIGMALALAPEHRHVWVVLGDGECQEGMIWEAAMLASRYRLANLLVLVDANGQQECGWGHDPTLEQQPVPDDLRKWSAFGWIAQDVDGHDLGAIVDRVGSIANGDDAGRPSVLIARTRKRLVDSVPLSGFRAHHTRLSDDEYRALAESLRNAS
jgi:transketolase